MTASFPLPPDLRAAFGLHDAALAPLPGDASSRRYARVAHPVHGDCLVLLDTPGTPHFDHFLTIGRHLSDHGFSAPRIHEAAPERGVALIEDFGRNTYTRLLSEGADETMLYDLAVDVLAALHDMPGALEIDLPPYDMQRLLDEVALFPDWFAAGVGQPVPADAREVHQSLWRDALASVAERREALVLRDYHVDNLLYLGDRNGVAKCGLLDFQDGLIGSAAYDLVSLTQDARRDVSAALEERSVSRYCEARQGLDQSAFLSDYHLLGAQRHTKVAGIFHRLSKRDGKPRYLSHVPRVLKAMERAVEAAGLTEIAGFYDTFVPGWRVR